MTEAPESVARVQQIKLAAPMDDLPPHRTGFATISRDAAFRDFKQVYEDVST